MNASPLQSSSNWDIARNHMPLKLAWDGMALAQLALRRDLNLRQKSAALRFYFDAGGVENLYPTLTRSGSHWSLLGLALAYDLANGGDGDYDYGDEFWLPHGNVIYSKLDWREPTNTFDPHADLAIGSIHYAKKRALEGVGKGCLPLVYHSHHSYFRLRTARLKKMRVAILLRNIYDSMESKLYKHRVVVASGNTPLEVASISGSLPEPCEENDFNFPWDNLLNDAIEFYNSWGDVMRWHRSVCVFHYDDMMANPVDAHKRLSNFWGLDLPDECIEEAFKRVTKSAMKKKLPDHLGEHNPRVAFRKKSQTLTSERAAYIKTFLDRKLVHDFGYGSEWTTRKPS